MFKIGEEVGKDWWNFYYEDSLQHTSLDVLGVSSHANSVHRQEW